MTNFGAVCYIWNDGRVPWRQTEDSGHPSNKSLSLCTEDRRPSTFDSEIKKSELMNATFRFASLRGQGNTWDSLAGFFVHVHLRTDTLALLLDTLSSMGRGHFAPATKEGRSRLVGVVYEAFIIQFKASFRPG